MRWRRETFSCAFEESRPSSRGFLDPGGKDPILIRSLTPPSQAGIALATRIQRCQACDQGFTLIEMVITVAMLATLAAIAIPIYQSYLDRARNTAATSDILVLQLKIQVYVEEEGKPPDSLSDLKWENLDPWGHPYQYLDFADAGPGWKGMARKDRFLVPLNSTYDLYSKGKDGQSKPPLTAKMSQDDIIRANDGAFVGLASMF